MNYKSALLREEKPISVGVISAPKINKRKWLAKTPVSQATCSKKEDVLFNWHYPIIYDCWIAMAEDDEDEWYTCCDSVRSGAQKTYSLAKKADSKPSSLRNKHMAKVAFKTSTL
jgi:hypothetical protein